MEQYLYSALQFNPSTQEQKKIPSLILEGETNSFFFLVFQIKHAKLPGVETIYYLHVQYTSVTNVSLSFTHFK